jgi:hypothetical protein
VFGRRVTWRITGGVFSFGCSLEGGRWVGPRVELGQGRLGSRESMSETGSRAEMAVEVSGKKAAEGSGNGREGLGLA